MKKIFLPILLLSLLPSCSLFSKKKKGEPEYKKIFCDTVKESSKNTKASDIKFLRLFAGEDAYKLMVVEWEKHRDFYDDSVSFLERQSKLKRLMKNVLSAKKKSYKQLSAIYGQFSGDLASLTEDKEAPKRYLSNLIDVDFEKEHQEKFKDIQFDEESVFAGFYVEVVSDFLNDDLYIKFARSLVLDSKGQAYLPDSVEFRLYDKKYIETTFRSSKISLKDNKSIGYFFTSYAYDFKPEEQTFYKSLSYEKDGVLKLNASDRHQYDRLTYNKCLKKKKKRRRRR